MQQKKLNVFNQPYKTSSPFPICISPHFCLSPLCCVDCSLLFADWWEVLWWKSPPDSSQQGFPADFDGGEDLQVYSAPLKVACKYNERNYSVLVCWQRYELNEIIWNLLYLSSSCRILSSSKRAWIWALSASSSLTCVSSNSWILFFCCCTSFCISVNVAVVFSLAYIISNLINIVSNALTLQRPVLRTNIYIVQMFGVSNNNNNNNNDVIIFNNIVVVLIKWMQP